MIYDIFNFFAGSTTFPIATSLRLIVAIWWLFCLVIISTYSANLIAFLAVDRYTPPFRTLYDVSNQQAFQFGVLGGTGWLNLFGVSNSKKTIDKDLLL